MDCSCMSTGSYRWSRAKEKSHIVDITLSTTTEKHCTVEVYSNKEIIKKEYTDR